MNIKKVILNIKNNHKLKTFFNENIDFLIKFNYNNIRTFVSYKKAKCNLRGMCL